MRNMAVAMAAVEVRVLTVTAARAAVTTFLDEGKIMSFHGKQYTGAKADLRRIRREEAEARNANTPDERRKKNRVQK